MCNGLFADNFLPVIRGNRMYKVRAQRVVVAAGAFEQPLVFRNNDLPGIMLSSGAQRLMRLYGVAPGRRAVVASANEHGYEVALDLLDAGVEVAAIAELRHETPRTPAAAAARTAGPSSTKEPPLPRRSATATSPACASPQSRAKASTSGTGGSSSATAW